MLKKSCTFAAERCRSGRSGRTRNAVNGQLFPGFESLSFRSCVKGIETLELQRLYSFYCNSKNVVNALQAYS